MILSRIEIANFRSIAELDISTDQRCQGFVGVNESGKSNILKAISLLSDDFAVDKNDVRIKGDNEKQNSGAYVEYFFSLDKDEMDAVVCDMLDKIYVETKLPSININGELISTEDFFFAKNTGLYTCDIGKETKMARYFTLNDTEKVSVPELMKVKDESNETIAIKSGNTIILPEYNFVEAACIQDSDLSLFEECKTEDLNKIFGAKLTDFIKANLPQIIFWEYNSKYLLPPSVEIDIFKNDPKSCLPLKSMFRLAGYNEYEIQPTIDDALRGRKNALQNVLNKVAKKSTEYLHKVWSEHKSVCFDLRKDGNDINIIVEDSEKLFEFSQRSDGFKRFITFLLALSAPVNNGEIENAIIVIDEPDFGIHILGQKSLLCELKKISEKNLVFYSTHSIFMVDKQKPESHFIVKKEKGITDAEQVSTSNLTDDEVIYNALGYSIFEALKQRNIIFEGWSDKRVFELIINSKRKDRPKINAQEVGYCNKEQCEGVWYLYNEFVQGVHTLEDFVKHDAYKRGITKIRDFYSELTEFDHVSFAEIKSCREDFIKKWIESTIKDKQTVNGILKELKDILYSNLKASEVEDSYISFLEALKKKSLI